MSGEQENAETVETGASKESDPSNLFDFELPDVTEADTSFIADQPDTTQENETGETGETIANTDTPDTGAEALRGTLASNGKDRYDPTLHRFPAEETPGGKWKKKPKVGLVGETPSGPTNAQFRKQAERYARYYGNIHGVLLGPDARVLSTEDLKGLIDAWERYLQENGYTELAPGWDLVMNSADYSLTVCQRPPVAEKLKVWVGNLYVRFLKRFRPAKYAELVQQAKQTQEGK